MTPPSQAEATSSPDFLSIRNLRKWFPIRRGLFSRVHGHVKAVDGVSFAIRRGETLGLVGESGSGKTTVGRCVLRLIEPTEGEVLFQGTDLRRLGAWELRAFRRDMQIVFQDPFASLNPRMTVGSIIGEPLVIHRIGSSRQEREERVSDLLRTVGLDPRFSRRYPHEFSGGQRQRIGVARALALNPKLMVLDEPVSALDVSVQAQVINLLGDLQARLGLTYLFIAHDLAVVEHISTTVAVMYLGKLVEVAPTRDLFRHPAHPYTQALLSAVPIPDPEYQKKRILLQGDIPTPINPPSGCRFRTRCHFATAVCGADEPPLLDLGGGHLAACHVVNGPHQGTWAGEAARAGIEKPAPSSRFS